MLEVSVALFAMMTSLGPTEWRRPALLDRLPSYSGIGAAPAVSPVFDVGARAVSNWRTQTRTTLEPAPLAAAAALFASGRPVVTRCVKLNNPWCIKRARWTGEIGSDDEEHTAFASTAAGADAAANLLRTYYVSLRRRSALDIVRRWAPAECRIGGGAGLSVSIAVGGLANTLRARYLASRGGVGIPQPRGAGTAQPRGKRAASRPVAPRLQVSRVPLPKMPSFRVPDIAGGMGERAPKIATAPKTPARAAPARPAPTRTATPRTAPSRPAPVKASQIRTAAAKPARPAAPVRIASLPGTPLPAMPPRSVCGSEEGRIQYYGAAIARALGVRATDDLKLFDATGQPTTNLLPVLVAMSAIELGYLHAGPELVDGAVERLKARLAALATPPPPATTDAPPPPAQ